MIETKMAMAKDAYIAAVALDIKLGFLKVSAMVFHLRTIPKIGGIKINAKKKVIELK